MLEWKSLKKIFLNLIHYLLNGSIFVHCLKFRSKQRNQCGMLFVQIMKERIRHNWRNQGLDGVIISFIKIQSGCVLCELIYNNDRIKMLRFAKQT